ncbi:MAG: hypothetical protein AAGF97_06960, partial [Planctomycetota bacterium]
TEVRFVSELPPIQGIVDAGQPGATETEAIWIERLETILEGLMRHNPAYLAISYMSVGEDIQQLCRVERNPQTGWVRRAPHPQLVGFEIGESDHDFSGMLPGDVILQTSDRIAENAPTSFRNATTVAAVSATFDEASGELFGFVAAQLDLQEVIGQRMKSIGDDVSVFLTDHNGIIQSHFVGGERSEVDVGQNIRQVIPRMQDIFGDSKRRTSSDGSSFYAAHVLLGGQVAISTAEVGVVVRINN